MKNYMEKDLLHKNYAIIECNAEDPDTNIVSLHEDYDKAKRRLQHLRKLAKKDFDRDIDNRCYILVKVDDKRVVECFNYNNEDE